MTSRDSRHHSGPRGGSLLGQGLAHPPDRLCVGFRVPTQSLHVGDEAVDLVERRPFLDRCYLLSEFVEQVQRADVRLVQAVSRLPPR